MLTLIVYAVVLLLRQSIPELRKNMQTNIILRNSVCVKINLFEKQKRDASLKSVPLTAICLFEAPG